MGQRWHAVRSGWPSSPGQVEQHHELLGLDNPIGQQPSSSTNRHRPAAIAKAAPAKDQAGLGRVHSKDGDDASDRAGQQGRCAAEPPLDLLGDKDLVGGYRASSRDLIPGHHLGAITLADALDQGPPLGKLLRRGCWRLDRSGCGLAHVNSILAIQSDPTQLRTIMQGLWWPQTSQPPRKGVLRISVYYA
jgi:hypothetical protein